MSPENSIKPAEQDLLSALINTPSHFVLSVAKNSLKYPTHWKQFHTYGIKTQPLATKCSQDISLLVNPDCKYHFHHFESNDTHLSQYKLSFVESGTEVALRQTANLASDE